MNEHVKHYIDYNNKIGDRRELYQVIARVFDIQRALYPGSHIDIGPSLFIPDVTYVDSFKGAIKFFKKQQLIYDFINKEKSYEGDSTIAFLGQDYEEPLPIVEVDLIISQYAGFVSQATKKYLRRGDILLCNDSHGDATMAYYDDDFEFVGVVSSENKIIKQNLEDYFVLSKNRQVDLDTLRKTMKGPKYMKKASNYLFKKK